MLVVGAGIGGLTAAACLSQRGHRVQVFEQAPELGEVGAGIQLSANGVKVLHDLGLSRALALASVRPKAYEFRRYDDGELLHRVPLNEDDRHESKHGAPYYHIHRVDAHAILAARVRELAPDCLHLGARVLGFRETADGVSLRLADGSCVEGDVLIGADGIKSAIREQIVGAQQVEFTGHVAWRLTVPVDRLPPGLMDTVVTVWCGPRNHAVMYYVRSGRVLNFFGGVERGWEEESWTARRPWSELDADYASWHPTVRHVVDAVERDQCFRWALNNRRPLDYWSTGRATLLGDAAHPTLPYMAQGAVMAIEDAAVLARCLDGAGNVALALDTYQRNRTARTARIVNDSTQHGDLYHISDAAEMRRAFAEKNIAKVRDEWLYCYDPLTVHLS